MNMKIRPLIILLIGIIVFLIVLIVWFGMKKSESTMAGGLDPNAISSQIQRTNDTPPSAKPPPDKSTLTSSNALGAVASTSTVSDQNSAKEGLAGLNDVPIVFFGRLEDQFGSPVGGAQIAASVRIYNGTRSGVDRFSVSSDAKGYFQINHGKGESLGLMPSKDGYALKATNTTFKYSLMYQDHYSPDQNHPTVIKMWKLQGSEPLVGIDYRYKLHYTNAPLIFDFLTGKIVPSGGDIKLTIIRPEGIVSQRKPQNWSVQIEAVNGGLVETSVEESRSTYFAPEIAYQPYLTVMEATNQHWSDCFSKFFFMESRNKLVYSKYELSTCINDVPDGFLYISFRGVANANSSRNWEASVLKLN